MRQPPYLYAHTLKVVASDKSGQWNKGRLTSILGFIREKLRKKFKDTPWKTVKAVFRPHLRCEPRILNFKLIVYNIDIDLLNII